MGRMHFGGFPGWVVWPFIHIAFLTHTASIEPSPDPVNRA
jgi:hypothetical protein